MKSVPEAVATGVKDATGRVRDETGFVRIALIKLAVGAATWNYRRTRTGATSITQRMFLTLAVESRATALGSDFFGGQIDFNSASDGVSNG